MQLTVLSITITKIVRIFNPKSVIRMAISMVVFITV